MAVHSGDEVAQDIGRHSLQLQHVRIPAELHIVSTVLAHLGIEVTSSWGA